VRALLGLTGAQATGRRSSLSRKRNLRWRP
jgi:hypothetical protein